MKILKGSFWILIRCKEKIKFVTMTYTMISTTVFWSAMFLFFLGQVPHRSLAESFGGSQPKGTTKNTEALVYLETTEGRMVLKLSNATPLHRDNFLKLVREGFYDQVLFHRVIKDFMIQGGDPESRDAKEGQMLGNGGPGYTVPAEFVDSLIHCKRALAAARLGDGMNPRKESSGSQFYIVQGRTWKDADLTSMEARSGRKYNEEQKEIYRTLGGTPHLDGGYTVFGQLIEGMDVLDKIAKSATGGADRPTNDVRILKAGLIK
jgi:peptidyl-prolyl cis-trans isomerase B (cyclophilin B)